MNKFRETTSAKKCEEDPERAANSDTKLQQKRNVKVAGLLNREEELGALHVAEPIPGHIDGLRDGELRASPRRGFSPVTAGGI